MATPPVDKQFMTRYLLGKISAGDRAQFEEKCFADEELFEQLIAAEDEMVRTYLRGEQGGFDRKDFESRYLSTPEGREKIEFERTLVEYLDSNKASIEQEYEDASADNELTEKHAHGFQTSAFQIRLLAAACILFAFFAGWATVSGIRLRREVAQLKLEQANLHRQAEDLNLQIASLNAAIAQKDESVKGNEIAELHPPAIEGVPFVLTSHLERNESSQRQLQVPQTRSSVPVQLELDRDDFPRYKAILETADGEEIWKSGELISQKAHSGMRIVNLTLPGKLLESRSYVLRLTGANDKVEDQEVADYIFRVMKH